jgi:ribose transport system substrate-binding protein
MKKSLLVLVTVFAVCIFTLPIFAGGGKEDTVVEGTDEDFVPYYKQPDFKAYVELPELTKEELGTVEDEMIVQPVDVVAPELVRIAVIGAATNPFFDIIKMGVDDAAEELILHNVKVDWIIPGSSLSSSDVNAVMDALLVKQYDAICTLVYNEGQIPYIAKSIDQGVPVAIFCADTQPNQGLFFIGQDLYAAGKTAGRAMGELLDGKGRVAIITGFFNVTAHELRRTGFVDVIEEEFPGIEIVGQVENLDQAEKARAQAIDFMTAYPDLAGIYVTAGGPIGAGQAVKEAGKAGDIKIVAFDPLPQSVEYLKDGSIQALIGQNPYAEGRDPVIRVFNYLMTGELPEARFMFTRDDVVTIETLDEFYASGQKG